MIGIPPHHIILCYVESSVQHDDADVAWGGGGDMAQVPHGRHGVVLVECYREAAKPEGIISGMPNEYCN